MSGRGRGRGRGAPLSQSKLLLKRSAMEAGIDEQHAVLDLTRPRLYADFLWHSSGDPRNLVKGDETEAGRKEGATENSLQVTKRSASTRSMVAKQREFSERFAASPHFVKIQQSVDIERYNERSKHHHHNRPVEPDEVVLESMGKKLANDERYVPLELGPTASRLKAGGDSKNKTASALALLKKKSTKLDDLEQRERTGKGDTEDKDENDEGDEEELLDPDDPVEEEGDDYIQDHYASDDEDGGGSDGGGDGEAVF